MAERLRVGVAGTGYLGSLHAAKYAALAAADLVAVYDPDRECAEKVAERTGCRAVASLEELLAAVDAVSIAAPTAAHVEVGLAAAAAGRSMLVEKPLAAGAAEGERLVAAAERAGVVLQVGHLERFNPIFEDMRQVVTRPRFIECHRLSPFAGRGADTNVVYDVMIHDLDLIAFLVGRPLVSVEGVGVPVLSGQIDIANARLRFEGGCVANVTASRVSLKRERKLRVFQEDAYFSIDFDERRALLAHRRAGAVVRPEAPMEGIEVSERSFERADPLADEIEAFVASVLTGARPRVGGREALAALDLADRVLAGLEQPA